MRKLYDRTALYQANERQLMTCTFTGQSTLPSSCPVCEHSPVSAEDCTVYKSLRTTIRVFLKTEEKKREAARPKTNGSAPSTPVEVAPGPMPIVAKRPAETPQEDATVPTNHEDAPEASAEQAPVALEPQASAETSLQTEEHASQQVSIWTRNKIESRSSDRITGRQCVGSA
jgi:hypothetical protein